MKNIDKPTNILAASLLGKSLVDLFPGAKLIGGSLTRLGFAYELEYFGDIPKDLIDYIEQKMNQAVKSEDEIRVIEMMRENAATLFTYHNQSILAELVLEDPSNIVSLIKIGSFYDYFNSYDFVENKTTLQNGINLQNNIRLPNKTTLQNKTALQKIPTDLSNLKAFRLIELSHQDGVIRVEGILGESQKELRQFIKKYRKYQETSFKKVGPSLKLITNDEEPVWLPNGIKLQETIINWWKQEHEAQGFQIVKSSADLSKIFSFLHQFPLKIAGYDSNDLAQIYCKNEDIAKEVISSLQFFAKMINIFRVDAYWVIKTFRSKSTDHQGFVKRILEVYTTALQECQIEFEIEEDLSLLEGPVLAVQLIDSIGRESDGPSLWITKLTEDRVLISRKLFGPLEQFVTLLVEQSAGRLPIWLTPDQLRVIPEKSEQDKL